MNCGCCARIPAALRHIVAMLAAPTFASSANAAPEAAIGTCAWVPWGVYVVLKGGDVVYVACPECVYYLLGT